MEATITGGRRYTVDLPKGGSSFQLPALFKFKSLSENLFNQMEQLVRKAIDERL